MKILVLYDDSELGNTELVAAAVARALAAGEVRLVKVDEAAPFDAESADLLVVGGPTQMHGISPRLRTFLRALPPHSLHGVHGAAFDTRLARPRPLTGSAAARIARLLQRKGAYLVAKPGSFLVAGVEGPLLPSELDRAARWAAEVHAEARRHAAVATAANGEAARARRRAFAHLFPVPLLTMRADVSRMEERVRPEETEEERASKL